MKFFFQLFYQLLCIALLTGSLTVHAQSYFADGLSPAFHKERRQAFRDLLPENGVAVIFNNPVKNRSNDTEFSYRPNSDFYYLTGFREPNAALIIFKKPQTVDGAKVNEIIYVQPRDPRKEQWDGVRLGVDGVKEKLGFEHAYVHSDFMKSPQIDWNNLAPVLSFDMGIIEGGSHNAPLNEMVSKLKSMSLSTEVPSNTALNQIMAKLRAVKTAEELVILEKAILISGKGHIESFKSIKPGVSERAVQGVHEFVHKAMGAEDIGYGSIVGSGNNTTILHYVENSVEDLTDGLILMDVGAEYKGYSGDITRTVPVKGVFSPEEKAIYEIVLEALEAGIAACTVGAEYKEIDQAARNVIDAGLVKLGLVKPGEKHPYFPHGTGHHLGLDVHDRGGRGILEPGMVLTVEPGIYIPEGSDVDPKWWRIGVRIEDNILITADGNRNLSAFVPKTVEDIERTMKEEGILQKLELNSVAGSF
ncbi:MAG: aminopeptidase P N-terminal domain-containing protein [Lunatimonas sp.]|uniref:aminopeptidase P N-terminal domain-containing protein n=1 Tax=Lunatimonas sp. TaxID=2060141 RepID=UPI00263B3B7D|nr:aminopeptidase P N-terminal domain-containing protein [Lunatimonas sp.]MCC5935706.1 aminopeptidase P N-terminal domain-containing protein [Lunatimonas sp.]